jgi:hypothetical protein
VVRGDAPRNSVRLCCALRLEEEEGMRRGRPFEGGGARGWLSPVEAVGGTAWMKSGERSSPVLGVRAVTCCRKRREVMGVL